MSPHQTTGATGSLSLIAPVAYQVFLEPGTGQLREFESPRVCTRKFFRGTFSCALIDLWKASEHASAGLDETSTIRGC